MLLKKVFYGSVSSIEDEICNWLAKEKKSAEIVVVNNLITEGDIKSVISYERKEKPTQAKI